ncbi:MAG TPA: DUF1684 domain-containing protein [Chitinophagaceae bacterium]|jgi:hypothetical protein|nr:DUF1684 domain-containing protein [Chitinophagaceae bacterium]
MRISLVFVFFLFANSSFAQNKTYKDSTEAYLKKYVKEHEVVTGKDKEFISFFPVNEKYRMTCRFERTMNSPWFRMESSGQIKKNYRVYGIIHVTINDTAVRLNIYQSQDLMTTQQYKDHLFIPFTDATSGEETYESGRYIDLEIKDIVNDKVLIDFNKAYNPYCAYVSGKYNCPIPPAENRLMVAIPAGEKAFGKAH